MHSIPASAPSLAAQLPGVNTWEFISFVGLAGITPYMFICGIYAYHFSGRKIHPKLRKAGDTPKEEHIYGWRDALFKPEGITAVVSYMLGGLALSLAFPDKAGWIVPEAIQTLTLTVSPLSLVAHFLIFDSTMWVIHWCQHRFRWLYHNTHAVHHTIQSPTMVCALTGYLPDTALLILLPLHITVSIAPWGNFSTVFVFAIMSLFHLHCIHSEFQHPWDTTFRKVRVCVCVCECMHMRICVLLSLTH